MKINNPISGRWTDLECDDDLQLDLGIKALPDQITFSISFQPMIMAKEGDERPIHCSLYVGHTNATHILCENPEGQFTSGSLTQEMVMSKHSKALFSAITDGISNLVFSAIRNDDPRIGWFILSAIFSACPSEIDVTRIAKQMNFGQSTDPEIPLQVGMPEDLSPESVEEMAETLKGVMEELNKMKPEVN